MIDDCEDEGHADGLPSVSPFADGETVTVTADTTPMSEGGSGDQIVAPPLLSLVPPIPSAGVPVFDLGAYRLHKRTVREQKTLDWLTVGAVVAVALLLIMWIAGDAEVSA